MEDEPQCIICIEGGNQSFGAVQIHAPPCGCKFPAHTCCLSTWHISSQSAGTTTITTLQAANEECPICRKPHARQQRRRMRPQIEVTDIDPSTRFWTVVCLLSWIIILIVFQIISSLK